MIVNCIIVTLIAFALSFVFLGKTILKRECYLSVAFDLSLILIGANWNNIKSFFAIMILLSVLVLNFRHSCPLYFSRKNNLLYP